MKNSDVTERLEHLQSKMDYNAKVMKEVNALEEKAVECFCSDDMESYHATIKMISESQLLYL